MGQIFRSGRLVIAAVIGGLALLASAAAPAAAQPDQQAQPPQPPTAAPQPQPLSPEQRQQKIEELRRAQKERRREKKRERQPRFFQLAATGLVGRVRVSRDGEGSETENGRGVALGAAFYPVPVFALTTEMWWQFAGFDECLLEYSCIRSVGKRHTILTFGVRYEPIRALSFDLAGGMNTTYIEHGEYHFTNQSAVFLATAAWHAPLRPVDLAVLLRAGTSDIQGARLTTGMLGLQVGKSW